MSRCRWPIGEADQADYEVLREAVLNFKHYPALTRLTVLPGPDRPGLRPTSSQQRADAATGRGPRAANVMHKIINAT